MSAEIALKAANNLAKDYDQYINDRCWIGPDIVYSLLESSISKDQDLLDIGIGTGLCSIKFRKAGLKVFGIDGSQEMLKACRKKNFTEELILFDLTQKEFPFKNRRFDLIIAYGVFHIIGYIEHIVKEVYERLSKNGIFLFSVVENDSFLTELYQPGKIKGIFEFRNSTSGIENYCHDDSYVRELLDRSGLNFWMKRSIVAFKDEKENREVYFSIYVCRR
jgi:predicted TPR repeat methyltransferase